MNIEKLRYIWDEHARAVYAYLLKLTRSEADARDFLQDVFHRLAKQPELLDGINGEARPYLLRTARNVVVDHARRNQVRDRVLGSIEADRRGEHARVEDPDAQLLRRAMARGLAKLPPEQREVVHARLWKGRTFDDIASTSGLSINTVASRYRYGIDKMRELLRDLYEELTPRSAQDSKLNMKDNTDKPLNHLQSEEALIQPLEQRRVPSATAAGALSILPTPEDHTADAHEVHGQAEPAVHSEEGGDDGEVIDISDEDLAFINLPVNFDDMVEGFGYEDGAEGVHFDPRILWHTMSPEDLDPTGGGGVIDPTVIRFVNADGETATAGHAVEEVEVMDENDPRIYQTMAPAGGVPVAEADGHADHGTPAPTEHAAPVQSAVTASVDEPTHVEVSVQIHDAIVLPVAVPHVDSVVEIEVPAASAAAFASAHAADTADHEAFTVDLQHHSEASEVVDHDIAQSETSERVVAGDATFHHWMAAAGEADASTVAPTIGHDTDSVEHVIELDATHDHEAAATVVDAGAISHGSSDSVRQSAMAAALTGSVLLSREARSRRKKDA